MANTLINKTETCKVSELKEKFGIKLTTEEIKEYGNTLLSMEEIEKIRTNKTTVVEIAKQKSELLKAKLPDMGNLDNSITKKPEQTAKQAIDKAKDIIPKDMAKKAEAAVEAGSFGVKFMEATAALEKSNNPIAKFFGWLMGIIGGWFGFKKASELVADTTDVKNKYNEKLSMIHAKTALIMNNTFGGLTKENQEILNKTIYSMKDEKQIEELYKKAKSGNLNYNDIKNIFPELSFKKINSTEQQKITKEFIYKKATEQFGKKIEANYKTKLDPAKQQKLQELIQKYTVINDTTIERINKIQKNETIVLSDITTPIFSQIWNSVGFMTGLVANDIIPASTLTMSMLDSAKDVINIAISGLGLSKQISYDTFTKSISEMNESEKAVLVGLLYRKGGLVLGFLGSTTSAISKFMIESVTNTNIKTFDILKVGLNYDKQAQNIEKIIMALDSKNFSSGKQILDQTRANLKQISDNYKILDSFKNGTNFETITKNLQKHNIDFPANIKTTKDLSIYFEKHIQTDLKSYNNIVKNHIFVGAEAELTKLNKIIDDISKAQKYLFSNNYLFKTIGSFRNILNVKDISRQADRIIFHFDNLDEAKQATSRWAVIANRTPDLLKSMFDKAPIIAVAGLSLNSQKPLETFKEDMKYLFPIVGPIMMINSAEISWKDGIEAKNMENMVLGGAFLTMDGVFLTKELIKGGIPAGFKYIAKPINDLVSIARGTAVGVNNITKAIYGNPKSLIEAIKNSPKILTALKVPGILKLAAVITAASFVGYEYFDNKEFEGYLDKEGKLDKKKIKSEVAKMDNESKSELFSFILKQEKGEICENIDIKIENNTLNMISQNPNVKTSWIVDEDILDIFSLNKQINFSYKTA